MDIIKNIDWYFKEPKRLKMKEPFKRGGELPQTPSNTVAISEKMESLLPSIKMKTISQDEYYAEYNQSLHKIKYNKSIPKVTVKVGGNTVSIEDLILTLPIQKEIHSLHTLHLTNNPMQLTMNATSDNEEELKTLLESFTTYKKEWQLRNCDAKKRRAVSRQKSTGDSATIFSFNKDTKRMDIDIVSWRENKVIIPNYDEYGRKIAVSIYYAIDDDISVIDTYDKTNMYRHISSEDTDGEFRLTAKETHGFTEIPVLYERDDVSWEQAITLIEMLELITNIYAVVVRRFGNFALWFKGRVDDSTIQSDGVTLILNDPNLGENGDAKVLEFPKPEGMLDYMDWIIQRISDATGVTFLNPEMLKVGSDISGTAIMLTMKNDLAKAEESIMGWADYADKFAFLFAQGLGMEEDNLTKYTNLKVKAKFTTWMPESKTVTINNLVAQKNANLISEETGAEKSPDANPDETERLKKQEPKQPINQQVVKPQNTSV